MNARARCTPEQLRHFWSSIWPETVRDFRQGGIELQTSDGPGEVRRSAGDNPIFVGLRHGVINLLLTVSVNTCVHELLHALMQDIFVSRPKWYQSDGREFRADSYATGLWLFHDGAAIRQSAQACLDRLRAGAAQ
jgi:hypothetical protein